MASSYASSQEGAVPASPTAASLDFDLISETTESMQTSVLADSLSVQLAQILNVSEAQVGLLLIDGRQSLVDLQNDIAPNVFKEQMNDDSDLMKLLKPYFHQQWLVITQEWFQTFLNEQKQDAPDLYEEILTRTATYGSKYLKNNLVLALVIQFLFEIDNHTINTLYNDIWRTLVAFGRQGLKQYTELLPPALLEIQMTDDTSPLCLALKQYYEQPLKQLLKENSITDRMNLAQTALVCVVNKGWWNGMNDPKVKNLIASKKLTNLIQALEQYLSDNNLPKMQATDTCPTDTSLKQTDETTTNTATLVTEDDPSLRASSQQLHVNMITTVETVASLIEPVNRPTTDTLASINLTGTKPVLSGTNITSTKEDEVHHSEPSLPALNYAAQTTETTSSLMRSVPPHNENSGLSQTTDTVITSTTSETISASQVSLRVQSDYDLESKTEKETTKETIDEKVNPHKCNIDEYQVILPCIRGCSKLYLSNLVQAGELMYIGKKRDEILSSIVGDGQREDWVPFFVHHSLVAIMYLLKRNQNLDDFMETLSFKLAQVYGPSLDILPKISLRMLIHILLLRSDMSLCRMIMSLLCKRNPVPFVNPSFNYYLQSQQQHQHQQLQTQYQIVPEILHVWNYNLPTILSFGIGPCFGKSTLLNAVFMSTFEQSVQSIYFQQTIDIDFGYGFLPSHPRKVNIADSHGQMTKQLLCKIQELFDGYIVQVEYGYLQANVELILGMIHGLSTTKFCLLLIRDVQPHLHQTCSKFIMRYFDPTQIQTFILPHVADQNNKQVKHSIRALCDVIFGGFSCVITNDRDYLKYALKQMVDPAYKQHLTKISETIMPLQRALLQLAEDAAKVDIYFAEYSNFEQLCKLQQELSKLNFYGEVDSKIHEVRQYIDDRKDRRNTTPPGIIFDLFNQVLSNPHVLMCLNSLATELKEQRNRFVTSGEMASQLPIQKNLSLELLWRNAIICGQYQTPTVRKTIVHRYYQYIEAGFPFEIIDGDNFYLHYQFLTDVFAIFRKKKILVISVIGPQNSGKSTLLNYMFGTFFDVRDGRCTRGIYGSFVKSNRQDFDYIMLIDTEGLLGVEREDKEFDRRLVLFCLAVSHLVIVNMIGEVNEALKTMLTLCADSLKQMNVNRVPQPIVHFVLNQKADLNIENNQAAINKIIADLKSFDLSGMIHIDPDTFHTLPNAFKKERGLLNDMNSPCLSKTEPDFMELVQLLCDDIINSAVKCLTRSSDQFESPSQWLKSSFTIFDTLRKFADLTYYRDINERRQDNEVREYISNKLVQEFASAYREQLCAESVHKSEREIEDLITPEMEKKQKQLNEDLENHLKIVKVSEAIRNRSRQFLRVQIIEMFNALRTNCKMISERARVQLLVQNGHGELKQLIENVAVGGLVMSEQEASAEFDNMYNSIVKKINTDFDMNERVKSALKHIYSNYNIYEKDCLPDYQHHILKHLSWLQNVSTKEEHIREEFILEDLELYFTSLAYQQPQVEQHTFTHDKANPFSPSAIDNIVHLNQQRFQRVFNEISTMFSSQLRQSKGFTKRVISAVTAPFKSNNGEKYSSEAKKVNEHYLCRIRNEIVGEWENLAKRYDGRDDNMFLQASKLMKKVVEAIVGATHNDGSAEIRQIQTDLIQKIVGIINTLIKDVNLELKPYCLTLNKPLKSIFHTCAVVLLTKYYYNEQQHHFLQTLSTLSDRKDDLKSYFINMVVLNTSDDYKLALSLCKQVKDYATKHLLEDGQKSINNSLRQYENLNRKWVQDCCDGKLLTAESQWYVDYIENPTKITEEFFKEMWDGIEKSINQNLLQLKITYVETLETFFLCIQAMHNSLKHKGRAAKFVDDIFQPTGNNLLNAKQNFNNKRRCMAILLFNYLCGQPIPKLCSVYNQKYNVVNDAYHSFETLTQYQKPNLTLIAITKAMTAVYDSCSIDNLAAFLQRILEEKQKIMDEFKTSKCDFGTIDAQDTYARLRDKIRGCPDRCPCCKRPCDFDHTQIKSNPGSKDNEHRCNTGHALRAMNGYKFETSDEASLFMCEQITDHKKIIVGTVCYKWTEFKQLHPDWIFESLLNDDELTRLHQKFLTIWSKIGVDLCRKYGMKFVTYNTQVINVPNSFHYVLLLDSSGSMGGTPWQDLIEAVKDFLQRRIDLGADDRITVIKFTDKAIIEFFDEETKYVNIERIKYENGGTNFGAAFEKVNECITRSKTADLKYTIIFMSDGRASFPEKQLNALKMSHGEILEHFWTLALGRKAEMSVLERINEKMNGRYWNLEDSCQLAEAYAEIARTG